VVEEESGQESREAARAVGECCKRCTGLNLPACWARADDAATGGCSMSPFTWNMCPQVGAASAPQLESRACPPTAESQPGTGHATASCPWPSKVSAGIHLGTYSWASTMLPSLLVVTKWKALQDISRLALCPMQCIACTVTKGIWMPPDAPSN